MSRGKQRARVKPGIPPDLFQPIREELTKCREDPSRFNETILCRNPYWSRQDEVCRSVVRYPITAAPAGNGVGKSRVGSGIALWFALCHPGSRVVIAAPTNAQLSEVLWAELTGACKSAESAGRHLGGKFDGLTLSWGDGWTIEGWGYGSVESKSGRHAGDLLAVIDEASGCRPSVLEAIASLNPSRYLYLGNPLRPEGRFYEICLRSADPNVNVITIPSLESPHISLVRSPWGMADATWLELSRSEYGEDSLWWQSHVLARFPGELERTLLPIEWLNLAAALIHVPFGPVWLGVDIALGNEGDDSCIVARDDTGVLGSWASNRWTLEVLAERVRDHARELSVRPDHIVFDGTGVGADFDNRLRGVGIKGARQFMGGRDGGEKFCNLRAAAGWALRRRLDPHRSLRREQLPAQDRKPTVEAFEPFRLSPRQKGEPAESIDYERQKPFAIPRALLERYRGELQGLRYRLDPESGTIALEPKEQFVARLKRSPNFLDALSMTFAFPKG